MNARSPSRRWLYFLVGAFLCAFAAKELFPRYFARIPVDFKSFYLASQALLEHHDLYDVRSLKELADAQGLEGPTFPYLYTPVLAFYLSPLSYLEIETAHLVWSLMSIALCGALILKSLRLALPSAASYAHVFWACVLFYALPFDQNFRFGQVNVVVLLLVVLAVLESHSHGRDVLAGVLLAATTLIKLTPALILIFFVVNRRYRVVYGFLGGGLAIALPTLIVKGGWSAWTSFFRFMPSAAHGETIPGLFPASSLGNFSLAGFFARWIEEASTVRLLSMATIGVFLALLVYQHVKSRRDAHWSCLLLPYLVLMAIASPLTYLHHVVYLYPGLLGVLLLESRDARSRSLQIATFVFCVVASTDFPSVYKKAGWPMESPALLTSLNLYALLALFFLALALLRLRTAAAERGRVPPP